MPILSTVHKKIKTFFNDFRPFFTKILLQFPENALFSDAFTVGHALTPGRLFLGKVGGRKEEVGGLNGRMRNS